MKIKDITNHLEQIAPLQYAEDFDNTGLLTGDYNTPVTGVLITLDCLEHVVDEAINSNCNLIVSFHPIIFKGLKHLRPKDYVRKTVVKAIKNDIAIYSMHTALDVAHGGVSYRMASAIGLTHIKTLAPKKSILKKLVTYAPPQAIDDIKESLFKAGAGHIGNYAECSFNTPGTGTFKGNAHSNPSIGSPEIRSNIPEHMLSLTYLPHLESQILKNLHNSHPYEEVAYEISTIENSYQNIGMGAIGNLESPMSTQDFLQHIKNVYNSGVVRFSLSRKRSIKKVAVLGGSGAFAIPQALQAGADAFITADLKYHDFFNGTDILLCDVGHYESEQFTKNLIQEHLSKKFSNFAILCAKAQTNPVNYF